MVDAISSELALQKSYFNSVSEEFGGSDSMELQTVYWGGGTPSLLSQDDLRILFSSIRDVFPVSAQAEITLEANPDDLDRERLLMFRAEGINRLSIGIQSFHDADLQFMNRAHNAEEARQCVDLARKAGFEQLSIDLIYGVPGCSDTSWAENVQQLIDWKIPHISAYALTVEPQTALEKFIEKGKVEPVSEDQAARQFEILKEKLKQAGYEHYEISNFCLPGNRARHNSAYWTAKPYLGVGPSAHSFDGRNRQWNIAHNAQYMEAIESGRVPFEREVLSDQDRFNERLMTGLRTFDGLSIQELSDQFSNFMPTFQENVRAGIDSGWLIQTEGLLRLTPSGQLLGDSVIASLFEV